jgi:hypothetical protein
MSAPLRTCLRGQREVSAGQMPPDLSTLPYPIVPAMHALEPGRRRARQRDRGNQDAKVTTCSIGPNLHRQRPREVKLRVRNLRRF